MWFHLYILTTIEILVSANVFTLLKEDNVTCVLTEDSVYSALYISSTNTKFSSIANFAKRPVTELTQWSSDDWNLTSVKEHAFYPLDDIRWEDLDEVKTNTIELNQKFASFSLCFNNSLILLASDDFQNFEIIHLSQKNTVSLRYEKFCSWSHYALMENKIMQIMSVNGTRTAKEVWRASFNPRWLDFTRKNVFAKIHEYRFRFSYSTSFTDQISYLDITNITNSKSLCIAMFVSVDVECFLDLILETGSTSVSHKITGFNNQNDPKIWKRVEIETDIYDGTGKLQFYRTRSDDKRSGYWAIDKVHLCKPKLDVYQINLEQKESQSYACRTLNAVDPDESVLCEKTGYFGKKCDVNCKDVFGESYPFCQSHKICSETENCECAWGYQGPACNKSCGISFWGLNCTSRYNVARCQKYNSVEGCTICKGNFFGEQCSEKFPVLLKPPILSSIKENKIEIFLENLAYREKEEVKPEFYQLQYKREDVKSFTNGSVLIPYAPITEGAKFVIQNVSTKEFRYQIRVILVVRNGFQNDEVPELVTNKKSLVATWAKTKSLKLSWMEPFPNANSFLLSLKCSPSFYSNETTTNITTSEHFAEFENLENFSFCTVQLYSLDGNENETKLIDEIDILISKSSKIIYESEVPLNISLSLNEVVIYFENSYKPGLYQPKNYFLSYKCKSEWCQDRTFKNISFERKNHETVSKKEIYGLIPFTTYEIEVVTVISGQNVSKTFEKLSPPTKPHSVQNLSVFSNTDNNVWLKWKNSYPPTGIVEIYKISYQNQEKFFLTNSSTCDIWKNFECVKIAGLEKNTTYNFTVKAKNFQFSEWSDPEMISASTKFKFSAAPSNIQIQLSERPKEIILKWEHPLYTYGPLEKFMIEVNDGEAKTYTMNINKFHEKYEYMIPVNYNKDYGISIFGQNQFEGNKVTVNATILKPTSKSAIPLIEWCLKSCYLLIPNQNINFDILVVEKRENITETEIKTIYKALKRENSSSRSQWIVEYETIAENHLEVEIGDTPHKAVSVKNNLYAMYFLFGDESFDMASYSVQDINTKQEPNNKLVYILVSVFCAMIVLVILGYVCIKHKLKRNQKNDENLSKTEIPLLRSNEKQSKSVKIKDFESYLKLSLLGNNHLKAEFDLLPNEKEKSCNVALRPENISKNRNRNYVPYDSTRVVLQDLEGVGTGDYINASYIDGYNRPKAYIACQGVRFSTVSDFWRMIWHEKVQVIVMATNFTENNGPRHCAEYWSAGLNSISEFGQLRVKMISEREFYKYSERIFELGYIDTSRKITHLQIKWSSNEESIYANDILPVVKILKQISENSAYPIVLHSGLGTDRNGTLILCDLALQMAKYEKCVNFYKLLQKMREQRPHMIRSVKNFVLAHLTVLEFLIEQESPFKKYFNENLRLKSQDQQIQYLERLYWHDTAISGFEPQSREHESFEFTSVDGYRNKFLLCEPPTKSTLLEFWKRVNNENIKNILSLDSLENHMWPRTFDNPETIIQIVQLSKVEFSPWYRMTQLLLETYDSGRKKRLNEHGVRFFELKNWTTGSTVNSVNTVLQIRKELTEYEKPVLVMSQDGISLFTILYHALEKYEKEGEIDICEPLRIMKRSDPQFAVTSSDLSFIYGSISEYFENYDQYKHIYNMSDKC